MSYNPEENNGKFGEETCENTAEDNFKTEYEAELSEDMEEEDAENKDMEERPRVLARAFVESSARAEDMKTSGVAFFVVGLLLIVVAVLIFAGIIPFGNTDFQKYLNSGIVLIFSIAFIAVSAYASKRAKELDNKSRSEERLTDEIVLYCIEHYEEPEISEEELDNIDEEKYFAREQVLRKLITEEYKGLTESYIDYLLDIIYTKIFENEISE